MAEMTAIERVNKHLNLEQPDRVGIAPMGEFYYAGLAGMTVADVLMDPWKADQAFEYGFKKHGGFDMAEVGFLLAMYLNPIPDMFSTYYLEWHLPGREFPPDTEPNLNERSRENPLMTEKDYDLILKEGFHRFFSFRRAGIMDLGLVGAMVPQTALIARKWWEQYQVPTMIDASMSEPVGWLSRLRGTTNFLLDVRRYPEKMLEVLDVTCDGLIAAALNLAEMVQAKTLILGCLGSADLWSPKMFEKFQLPFILRAANAAVAAGYRLQYHFDTNWTPMLEYPKELPPKSGFLHLDERTDIIKAKKV
ncbi:MAG: hypothetical protein H5T63_08955, partial [Chloroflexi bacterium]|nr:hypothetical protein [Chloroflexota bacterium]